MQAVSLQEALCSVYDHVPKQDIARENIDISHSLGRVLARDIHAKISSPSFRNSAMDGFAVRGEDLASATIRTPVVLAVVGEARAGHPWQGDLVKNQAVAISTGALVPARADTVVRVEDVLVRRGEIVVSQSPEVGCDIREIGEDYREGDLLLPCGTTLSPEIVSLLAAAGYESVECATQPSVAVITTGDELCQPGQQLAHGQIYNSNGLALTNLAKTFGAQVKATVCIADSYQQTYETINAMLTHDIVLISGGVSVGQHDYVKAALANAGVQEVFWRVKQRPGGPLWFGVYHDHANSKKLVFGLPGNPVSAMVLMYIYVRRAISAKVGVPRPRRFQARLTEKVKKKVGKAHFVRVKLLVDDEGCLFAKPTVAQGSHILTSMVGADGVAILPADYGELQAGELVEVELFRDNLIGF